MMTEWEEEQFGYELSLRADLTRVVLFLLRRWRQTSPWMQEGTRPGRPGIPAHRAFVHRRALCRGL